MAQIGLLRCAARTELDGWPRRSGKPEKDNPTMNTEQDTKDNERTEGTAQSAPAATASVSDAASAFAVGANDIATTATARAIEDDPDEHRKAVNDGRLKKMSDENRQLKEQLEEMKRQMAEQSAKAGAASFDDLPEMEEFDDKTRKAIYAGANKIVEQRMRELGGDIEALRRQNAAQTAAARQSAAARAQSEAFDSLEKTHPGLLGRLGSGDLAGAWQSFLRESDDYAGRTYGEIVQSALARGNGSALVKVAKEFVRARNLQGQYNVQAGAPRSAAPAAPVGTDAGGKKVYPSRDAILQETERIAGAYRKGFMDRKSYDARSAELEDALRTGRFVK